jgi:ubiquinone/menaquinone biosynthesis C-methylase UbiE
LNRSQGIVEKHSEYFPAIQDLSMPTAFGLDLAGFSTCGSAFARADRDERDRITVTVFAAHCFADKVDGCDDVQHWLGGLADCHNELGQLDVALQRATEACDLAKQAGAGDSESFAVYMIAVNMSWRGRSAEALLHFQKSLALDTEHGNEGRRTAQLRNIGYSLAKLGRDEEALSYYARARTIDEQCNNRADLGILLYRIAAVHLRRGDIEEALKLCQQSIELGDDSGMIQTQIEARHLRAMAYLLANQTDPAYAASLEARGYRHPNYDCDTGLVLGITALRLGDRAAAIDGFNFAIETGREVLKRCPESYSATLTLALALCGRAHLSLPVDAEEIRRLVSRARQAGSNPGSWADCERLFELMHAGKTAGRPGAEFFLSKNSVVSSGGPGSPREPEIADYFAATADKYESAIIPAFRQFAATVVTLAQPKGTEYTLDAGTGTGILARLIAPAVKQVTGVDVAPAMIHVARMAAAGEGIANAEFVIGDLYTLPFASAEFDLIVASFGLNATDPDCIFKELARVLRSGGRLAFLEWGPDAHPFDAILQEVMGRYRVAPDRASAELWAAHLALQQMDRWERKMRSPPDYHDRLSAAGFQEIEVKLDRSADCMLSLEQFLRYKLTWTHHRLQLAAMGAEQGRCLAELHAELSGHIQADDKLHYTPQLFRISALRS